MKLSKLTLFRHSLPVKGGGYRMANAFVESLETTIVRLESTCGWVGWGETCPVGPTYAPAHAAGAQAALITMAPGLMGTALDEPLLLQRHMDSLLNGHHYAKAAIDMAAYDMVGKKLNCPAGHLLGGAMADRIPSYYASPVGSPDDTARIAEEKAGEGYPRMQVKISGRPVEIDIECVTKVWERIGSRMRLAVDGNRGLTTRDALLLSNSCKHIPFIFEQPCNSLEEIAAIRGQLHHPVYLDESATDLATVISAVGQGLVDGFGMKLTRMGGLTSMARFRDICEARQLPHTVDDAWGGDIIAAACVQVGATVTPRLFEGTWLAQPYIEGHYDANGGIVIDGGHIEVPKAPGLGISPDESLFSDEIARFT